MSSSASSAATTTTTSSSTTTTTKSAPTNDNRWATLSISKEDLPYDGPVLVEESSFMVLFPAHREKYLKEAWPTVTQALAAHGIAAELNLAKGSMVVRTTSDAIDPYAIVNARDLIKLLARSVPVEQALRIMRDDVHADIIKLVHPNKAIFAKRRQRLIGPDGATLKAIEILTNCYVLVEGKTVAAMGPLLGLKQVRKIAEECMANVHPIYNIKPLMVRRELAKDPAMQHEDWSRYLPKYKKNAASKKKKRKLSEATAAATATATAAAAGAGDGEHGDDAAAAAAAAEERDAKRARKAKANERKRRRAEKVYSPFPPPQLPRKVDLQLESGEYFLTHGDAKRRKTQRAKQAAASEPAATTTSTASAAPSDDAVHGAWKSIAESESRFARLEAAGGRTTAATAAATTTTTTSAPLSASQQAKTLSRLLKKKKKDKKKKQQQQQQQQQQLD